MLPVKYETEVLFEPFPKQDQAMEAALSGSYDFILYGGAVRGGKTFWLLALFIFLARVFPGSRWAIVRKDLPTIKKNLYPSWDKIKPSNFIKVHHLGTHTVTFKNGSQIIFYPEQYKTDKELDRWKGFEVNGFGFEEINECQKKTLGKAFERAGTYIVKGLKVQPPILVVATCNPTQGWVKDTVHTPYKEGKLPDKWLYIQSRVYDNLPLLREQPGLIAGWKRNMSRYEYQVYVEGDWDVQLKTGGEFLRDFEMEKHVKTVNYDDAHLVSMSMDANAYPYMSFTFWQFIPTDNGGTIIRQFAELTPEDPDNTAARGGDLVVEFLDEDLEYTGKVAMFGDKSTKNRNVINEDHLTIFGIVEQKLKEAKFRTWDRMWKSPPAVHLMADFVNAIFRGEIPGLSIEIDETNCKKSIGDYIAAKTNNDGGILKNLIPHPTIEGLKYQENGHLTDTLKDIICQAFPAEFKAFTNRFKAIQLGGINVIQRGNNITF